MEDKPNYFAILPANVRYDNQLKDKAKLLFAEISSLCQKDGKCWATNQYFANLYEVSVQTISSLFKNLEERGYIKREYIYREGTKEILYRYTRILVEGYTKNLDGGIQENFKENNTSNNNTSINNIVPEGIKTEFDEYIKMRKMMKRPLTSSSTRRALHKLQKMSQDVETQKKILNQSVDHCWLDLYPIKQEDKLPEYDDSKNRQMSDEELEELLKLANGNN